MIMSITMNLKNKLLVEAQHTCAICNKSGVHIHHIDGDKKNNDESNLIVLCLVHHDEVEKSKEGKGLSSKITEEQLHLYKNKQKEEKCTLGTLLTIPPMPYFAPSYPLQKNFTGRKPERKELTEWFTKAKEPMFIYTDITGAGGIGKSALTWCWLQEDIIERGLSPEGVIWWSFDSKEARFESFLTKAIQYISKGEINLKGTSAFDMMDMLFPHLCNKRFLLVFDGLERILTAYAGLDSPYQSEEVHKDERGDYRRCIDQNSSHFLQELASRSSNTKVLITSRLLPKELDDIKGVVHKVLEGMNEKDAVEFFESQGVNGTSVEIKAVCKHFGYHPLSLRVVSSAIVKDPKYMGDIKAYERYDLSTLEIVCTALEIAYNSLDSKKRPLISKLAAFRYPMGYDAISIFKNEFKTEDEFDRALIELEERGLLLRDKEHNKFDLHPVVRKYYYHNKLKDKMVVHSKLKDYFTKIPKIKREEAKSVDDLASDIELYYHTAKAGEYDAARDLYCEDEGHYKKPHEEQLRNLLYYNFRAYQMVIELTHLLFPDGENKLPRLKKKSDQAWALNTLASAYADSGQPRRFVHLFKKNIAIREEQGDKTGLVIGLSSFAHRAQIPLGEFNDAESKLRRAAEISHELEVKEKLIMAAVASQELGKLLAYKGVFDESERQLNKSFELFSKSSKPVPYRLRSVSWAYCSIRSLLMSNVNEALKFAEKSRELANAKNKKEKPDERNIILAEYLLGAAYITEGFIPEAKKHLTEALTRERKINLVEFKPDILLEFAKLHFQQNHKEEALKCAEEALQIADRCEYRLKQADIHNFLAEFYLNSGDLEKAKEHAEIVKERGSCGYVLALEKAQKLLKKL